MIDLPFYLRLGLLAVAGAVAGQLVNWAVARFHSENKVFVPWSLAPSGMRPRNWIDRLPVAGWISLSRESSVHGRRFWLRPLFVELVLAAALPWLYWWQVGQAGLVPAGGLVPAALTLHLQFALHAALLLLMLAGSLIDFDERIIPDAITVPGTLLGICAAAAYPWALLPDVGGPLLLSSPFPWPQRLEGFPGVASLGLAAGCWCLWCGALLPLVFSLRRGWRRAVRRFAKIIASDPATPRVAAMMAAGLVAITAVWYAGGDHWRGLLTALVGTVAGGAIVWFVRVVASPVLQQEAMGFGDVTLMFMIGSVLGWQACLMVFFFAPFAGLVFGITNLLARGDRYLPYGPFLCLAAALVMVRWATLWDAAVPLLSMGWLLFAVLAACLVLMVPLLVIIRFIREAITGPD